MTNSEYGELVDHLFLSWGVKLPQLPAHSTEASSSKSSLFVCVCVCEKHSVYYVRI